MGVTDGLLLGGFDGAALGLTNGFGVGELVGSFDGALLAESEGLSVESVGDALGGCDGTAVGLAVGDWVGDAEMIGYRVGVLDSATVGL